MENVNFRLMDTQIEYERVYDKQQVRDIKDNCILRPARKEDLDFIKEIASNSFSKTRFHADPNLGIEASNRLYEIWLEKSVNQDFADRVIVAEVDNEPVGFATWKLGNVGHCQMGRLELTAVSEKARNRGIYTSIVNEGIKWYQDKADGVYTSTQINNIAGQRVWIKLGFTLKNNWYVFHGWL
jgi:GNAT superfamily N-acetyltransferase